MAVWKDFCFRAVMLCVNHRHSFGADCFLFSLQPFLGSMAMVSFVALREASFFSVAEGQPLME